MEAPHIFQTPKCLKNGVKQKPRFLLCELKKAMEGLFQHFPSQRELESVLSDKDISKRQIEKFHRLLKRIPAKAEPVMKVLKGHVLIEALVRSVVAKRMQNSQALSDARLDCHQYICLARAVCNDEIESWVWTALTTLDSIRNELASGLPLKDLEARLDGFTSFVEKQYAYTAEQFGEYGRIDIAIAMLHVYLSELLESDGSAEG